MSYFKGIGRKSGSFAGRKLPLVGLLENKKHTIFNEYTAGSGVGASSVATRRLKKQRARIYCAKPINTNKNEIIGELIEINDFETNENIELPLTLTVDFGGNENEEVDNKIFNNHLNRVIENTVTSNSIKFATISTVLLFIDTTIVDIGNIEISQTQVEITGNEDDIFFTEHEIIKTGGITTYNVNTIIYTSI